MNLLIHYGDCNPSLCSRCSLLWICVTGSWILPRNVGQVRFHVQCILKSRYEFQRFCQDFAKYKLQTTNLQENRQVFYLPILVVKSYFVLKNQDLHVIIRKISHIILHHQSEMFCQQFEKPRKQSRQFHQKYTTDQQSNS